MRILVTGASGFIGSACLGEIEKRSGAGVHSISGRGAVRQPSVLQSSCTDIEPVGGIDANTDWSRALRGVQAVIHTAGRAHTFDRGGAASLAGYRIVNTAGTLNLAEQVAAASIPRLVFLSSIGVNGAETSGGRPFTEDDEPQPHSDYARSKWEAEQGLLELAAKSGLEVVIVRPPLVYGFGAPGNFGTILRAMRRGWPLPLGAIHNKRSFVALENLVDFLLTCAVHPLAAHETFLVSDDQDLSTTEFVRAIALANGRSPRLLPIPVSVLRVGALALGRAHLLDRLVCNLQVSVAKARRVLNWTPPFSLTQALSRTLSPDAKSPPDGLAHR